MTLPSYQSNFPFCLLSPFRFNFGADYEPSKGVTARNRLPVNKLWIPLLLREEEEKEKEEKELRKLVSPQKGSITYSMVCIFQVDQSIEG